MKIIRDSIGYIKENWDDSYRIQELTRLLQDHTKSPVDAFEYVKNQKPEYYLSTDMRDQALQLDTVIKRQEIQKLIKKLKISGSNISEIISNIPILNNIVGNPTLFDRIKKYLDGVPLGLEEATSPITRHPELQTRMSSAMRGTVEKRIKDAVKSLIGFRLSSKNPFANNATENLLTILPLELQLKILSHVPTASDSPVPAKINTEILFELMKEGLTYQNCDDYFQLNSQL